MFKLFIQAGIDGIIIIILRKCNSLGIYYSIVIVNLIYMHTCQKWICVNVTRDFWATEKLATGKLSDIAISIDLKTPVSSDCSRKKCISCGKFVSCVKRENGGIILLILHAAEAFFNFKF